jgi:type II secretory pathway component GspD/PulD (secretin)
MTKRLPRRFSVFCLTLVALAIPVRATGQPIEDLQIAPPAPTEAQKAQPLNNDSVRALSSGDMVLIDVFRHPELSTTTQLDPGGNVTLPYVGNISLTGLTESEASERVTQALRRILKNPRATVTRSGSVVMMGTRTPEMITEVVSLENADARMLSESLAGMTSSGGNIGYDENTNSLIITDAPTALHNIMTAVSRLDGMQSQRTQIRIETRIAEVQTGAVKDLGIRWWAQGKEGMGGYYPYPSQDINVLSLKGEAASPTGNEFTQNSGGQGGTPQRQFLNSSQLDRRMQLPVQVPLAGQLFFGLLNDHFDLGALLDALVSNQKAELLANPSILTVNHKMAEIRRVEEFPYTEFGTEFAGRGTFSTRFLDLGIILRVTPHVKQDDGGRYVQLELEPEVSFPVGANNGVPIRSVRSSKLIANVRDGQTLVVGGIYRNDNRNTEQQVPGLGKVPILGNLFKRTEKSKIQTELMVFATPTIHDTPETVTWDRMLDVSNVAFPPKATAQAQSSTPKETRQE